MSFVGRFWVWLVQRSLLAELKNGRALSYDTMMDGEDSLFIAFAHCDIESGQKVRLAVLERRGFIRHNDKVRKGAIDRSSKRRKWC